jgi:hypothetical protein
MIRDIAFYEFMHKYGAAGYFLQKIKEVTGIGIYPL